MSCGWNEVGCKNQGLVFVSDMRDHLFICMAVNEQNTKTQF